MSTTSNRCAGSPQPLPDSMNHAPEALHQSAVCLFDTHAYPMAKLLVYYDSSRVELKRADLAVFIPGGEVRFACSIEIDELSGEVIPDTLRFDSVSRSEFVYDGRIPAHEVLNGSVSGPDCSEYPLAYTADCLKTAVFNRAAAIAMLAIAEQEYYIQTCF